MPARPATMQPLLTKALSTDTDRDLLRRFARDQDGAAFDALVKRHGLMVFNTCRRVLGNQADAEDACQATFLVLARKAASARWQASVASWLYATARQVALNARTARSRRTRHEGRTPAKPSANPLAQITGEELLAILDEELGKLPERYRAPVVLCCLEGLTRDEAARQRGVPAATLKGQLERGRRRLHEALARRGVTLGAGLLALMATSPACALPSRMLDAIRAMVAGEAPPSVAALAGGVVVNGAIKKSLLVLAVAGIAALGLGLGSMSPIAAERPKPAPEKPDRPTAKADPKEARPKAEGKERTIAGKVLGADGKPIVAELFVNCIQAPPQPLGKSNADGTFRVTVALGRSGGWLVSRADGHGMEFAPVRDEAETEVTLKLPKDRPVRGRVIDPEGKPLAGARVTVSGLTSYDNNSFDKHMKQWTAEYFAHGIPPGGDRSMWFRSDKPADRECDSPIFAKTDADGKFELTGVGADQLVGLTIRASGVATTHVTVMNRAGFDPKPYIETATESAKLVPERQGRYSRLYGPGPQIIVEREKVIRGTVTMRDTGKPLAGMPIRVETSERLAYPSLYEAVTDKDGKYEVRGVRKHGRYKVACWTNPKSGYFPALTDLDDTVGYEPITLDFACARGVIVTGTIKDKVTGKPVSGRVRLRAMPGNPFAKEFPGFNLEHDVASDGEFQIMTIPGPVLIVASTYKGKDGQVYRRMKPDPKYPDPFRTVIDAYWRREIETKETDREVKVAIEVEPAPRMTVKVVDAEGKPVTGTHATGIMHTDYDRAAHYPDTDTLTVFNVEPGDQRLLAVVHAKRRLVGTAVVKEGDKDPVVKLGAGATLTGRIVDASGKPIGGATVDLYYTRREVSEVSEPLTKDYTPAMRVAHREAVTDANGEFRFDALFPGHEFRLLFYKGKKRLGPEYDKPPRYSIDKHGDALKLGDVKVEPAERDE